tara:strand:+ start:7593 stop:7904 length:312 start_codon:yes stop_codon:yes gene_type:complete
VKIIIIKKNKTTLKNKCKIKFITGFVILEKNFKSHLLDFGDIPVYAHSLQKLKVMIIDNLKNKNSVFNDLNNYQKDILKFWANNPDGHVGKKMPVLPENLIKS